MMAAMTMAREAVMFGLLVLAALPLMLMTTTKLNVPISTCDDGHRNEST